MSLNSLTAFFLYLGIATLTAWYAHPDPPETHPGTAMWHHTSQKSNKPNANAPNLQT